MYMKKFTIGFITFVFLLSAQPNQASALTYTERQAMLAQIELLTEHVRLLQQLILERGGGARVVNDRDIYETRFYDGNFEAIYKIKSTDIVPLEDTETRRGDTLLWETYVDLVGSSFVREHLVEFRIFNDEDNIMGAFIEQKPNMHWVLAINRLGENLIKTHDNQFMVELLLHESAHIPFFENDNYQNDFTALFWSTRTMNRHRDTMEDTDGLEERSDEADVFYESHSSDFVSSYAASSPTEDMVESFVTFVASRYPRGGDTEDEKVRFFYDYPELVSWRAELRDSGIIDVE